MIKSKILCVIAILLCSQVAMADLIRSGDVIADSITGLNWLEITQTKGLSYASVQIEFGAGGLFDGWTHANLNQMQNLRTNYGIGVLSTIGYTSHGPAPGNRVITSAVGMFDDGGLAGGVGRGVFTSVRSTTGFSSSSSVTSNFIQYSANFTSPSVGHWLVEVASLPPVIPGPGPVPEPASALLLVMGLGLMRLVKRGDSKVKA